MSGEDSATRSGPLGTPTPGQMALNQPDFQQPNSENRRSSGGSSGSQTGGLGDPTPGQVALRALEEQQDAMDTIRADNRQQLSNSDSSDSSELQGLNYNGNLSDLFKAPFSQPREEYEEETEIEFQQTGMDGFREALLAEQRQQQAILQERQRSFDQYHVESEVSLSPSLKSQNIQVPVLPPAAPSNLPTKSQNNGSTPPLRPARINNSNRGVSIPSGTLPAGPSHKHNRTVSWSLGNLETFHSDNPVESYTSDRENQALNENRSLNTSPGSGLGYHRKQAPSGISLQGGRRVDLHDIMGMAPFESEAETNILRALDEFGLQSQMSQNAEQAEDDKAFFANLPSDFSLSDELLGESDSEREKIADNTASKRMDDSSKHTMSNSARHQKKASDFSSGGLSAISNHQPPLRPRLMSGAQGVSTRNLQPSSPTSKRRTSIARPRAHRHTQSVEAKLFGLTAQLSKLDVESLNSVHDDDEDSLLDELEEDKKAAKAYKHHRVFSSADKVAEATHGFVKKSQQRDASHQKRPSLLGVRTPSADSDFQSNTGQYKRGSLSAVLRPRASTPTGDIEAQERASLPVAGQGESNFSKWRLRRDSYSKNEEGDTSEKSDGSRSNQSLGVTSQSKRHHAPTVIDEGDEDEDDHDLIESNRKTEKAAATRRRKRRSRNAKKMLAAGFKEDWELFNEFLSPRRRSIWLYCKAIFCFVVLPATGVAALLFYVFENPTTLVDGEGSEVVNNDATKASASWWILFLGVRQVVTLSLAMATQSFVIDYIALGSRFSLQLVGPVVTLLIVQSKGWPFIIAMWGLYDVGLLSGSNRFVHHWCYWQDWIRLFNEDNPSGNVTESESYHQILRIAMIVGAVVAAKRLIIGLFLGRQTFVHYGEELAKILKKLVLVSEVAALSRQPLPQNNSEYLSDPDPSKSKNLTALMSDDDGSNFSMNSVKDLPDVDAARNLPKVDTMKTSASAPSTGSSADQNATSGAAPQPSNTTRSHTSAIGASQSSIKTNKEPTPPPSPGAPPSSNTIPHSVGGSGAAYMPPKQQTIMDMLERWEEPERFDNGMDKKVTLGAVLQFRRAIAFTKKKYPFSPAFGPAETREMCIESAQNVYDRLLLRHPGQYDELNFETLAELATDSKGSIDEDRLKDLIKLFRPDRDGQLTRLAFTKSIDTVYKRLRLLSANIHNSSQIDIAVENIVNFGFYSILGCIALARLGIDPLQLFFSLSSIILAFAFMFGSGAAKYFEGVLLILLQRPFGVGDRIHVSNCQQEVSGDGSAGWIVEKVNLFNTTVCFGTTNERATISNGSLASARIINAARSPNAIIYVQLKFALDVPYEKIMIFRRAAEQHVAARPREWLAFLGFRAGAISVDLGYITYTITVQHREPWQHIITILESKATLTTYCLEVAKQLDMRYRSPPLPVDLNVFNTGGLQIGEEMLKKNA